MAITLKKFCEVCGKELKDFEDIVYTCTEGILDVKQGYFCEEHKKDNKDGKEKINIRGLI